MKYKSLLKLFTSARRWVKWKFGETANGTTVVGQDPRAVRWCLLGGVRKCYGGYTAEATDAIARLRDTIHRLYPEFADRTDDLSAIIHFNNAPNTDFRKLQRVIKAAKV